jgi:hypothetical protein
MTRKLLVVLALIGLLSPLAVSHASAAIQTTSDVVLISDPTAVVGASTVTRTGRGISMSLHTTGLPAGDAGTIWWMMFNAPRPASLAPPPAGRAAGWPTWATRRPTCRCCMPPGT